MIKIVLITTSVFFLISSCNDLTSNSSDSIPEVMKLHWTGVNIGKFPVKFGQVLKFNNSSLEIKAVVLDFSEDEGGQWIGVCFIDQNRLFGRQIPNGMINKTCLDLLDLTYIQNDALNNYEIIDTVNINKDKIGVGSKSTAINFTEIERDFNWGLEKRKKQQTPCDEGITDLNSVRECYFNLEKIGN